MRGTAVELVFEVSGLSEELEDAIDEHFDALVATHGRTTKLTITAHGENTVEAADSAIATLAGLGVHVVRLIDDLVTRTEIAERARVTTQAVGLWTRGERSAGHEFPEPFIRAGSATLWLWGEVVDFLRATGSKIDSSLQFPTRSDIQVIAGILVREHRAPDGPSQHAEDASRTRLERAAPS